MERASLFKMQKNLYQAKCRDIKKFRGSTSHNLKFLAYFATRTVVY